ncbi:DUF6759 domain-containing protein [Chryseobacterium sp. CBSDS_008]|uniref:DUF6759 domain-containing protein n=1 Tax=Chryseobacterium sp. CBSDS_008 TaxID=3415265 RepID=UPI003CEE5F1C
MEARPVTADIPKSIMRNPDSEDAEEFKKLIAETTVQHKEKTVKVLNAMFNKDISRNESILLFKNSSDCNIVLRIEGKEFYNLAVAAHSENFIVLTKGLYTLNSNICDMKYSSTKDIKKSIFVTIDNPKQPGAELKSVQKEPIPEKSPKKTKSKKNKIG